MSRHSFFQLVQLRVEIAGAVRRRPVPDRTGAVRTSRGRAVPPRPAHRRPAPSSAEPTCGRYVGLCAFLSAQTEQALSDSRPEHLLRLTYEDLVLDPAAQLTALGEFLGFADPPGWAARVAHRVRAPAPTRSPVPV